MVYLSYNSEPNQIRISSRFIIHNQTNNFKTEPTKPNPIRSGWFNSQVDPFRVAPLEKVNVKNGGSIFWIPTETGDTKILLNTKSMKDWVTLLSCCKLTCFLGTKSMAELEQYSSLVCWLLWIAHYIVVVLFDTYRMRSPGVSCLRKILFNWWD